MIGKNESHECREGVVARKWISRVTRRIHPSIHPSIHSSIHLFIHSSIHPSIREILDLFCGACGTIAIRYSAPPSYNQSLRLSFPVFIPFWYITHICIYSFIPSFLRYGHVDVGSSTICCVYPPGRCRTRISRWKQSTARTTTKDHGSQWHSHRLRARAIGDGWRPSWDARYFAKFWIRRRKLLYRLDLPDICDPYHYISSFLFPLEFIRIALGPVTSMIILFILDPIVVCSCRGWISVPRVWTGYWMADLNFRCSTRVRSKWVSLAVVELYNSESESMMMLVDLLKLHDNEEDRSHSCT